MKYLLKIIVEAVLTIAITAFFTNPIEVMFMVKENVLFIAMLFAVEYGYSFDYKVVVK
ncbi:MAG: hypothetical protein RR806_01310 [Oscillospiraceae bacterium]